MKSRHAVGPGTGAPRVWRLVHEHVPEALQIVDLLHAQEQIWGMARAIRACDWLVHPWP